MIAKRFMIHLYSDEQDQCIPMELPQCVHFRVHSIKRISKLEKNSQTMDQSEARVFTRTWRPIDSLAEYCWQPCRRPVRQKRPNPSVRNYLWTDEHNEHKKSAFPGCQIPLTSSRSLIWPKTCLRVKPSMLERRDPLERSSPISSVEDLAKDRQVKRRLTSFQ